MYILNDILFLKWLDEFQNYCNDFQLDFIIKTVNFVLARPKTGSIGYSATYAEFISVLKRNHILTLDNI